MMRSAKILGHSIILNTLAYMRVRESFFFSFIFPVFIFILFVLIWGGRSDKYLFNLFTGVIGMTIASDALFGIGPVIRSYKSSNLLKFLRNLPMNILLHFSGLFISRIIAVFIAIALLFSFSVLFDYTPSPYHLILLIAGSLLGTALFAFMGLFISFYTKPEAGRGVTNLLYFIMLFTSGAFYPIDIMPPFLQSFAQLLPLTHLLHFLRGEIVYLPHLTGWIFLFGILFYFTFSRVQIKR